MCTAVDDDQVLVSVDGDSFGRVDISSDAVVEGTVDGASGMDVTCTVQKDAAVAFVTND